MRLSFYRFPDTTPEDLRVKEGCEIFLKNGNTTYAERIPEEHRDEVSSIGYIAGPWNISVIKKYMKIYGGSGYTEHYDRSGSLFGISEITLTGNNSQFKYNRHL